MPVSKNRRDRNCMKPRTFRTLKSARRYMKRFKTQFFMYHKNDNVELMYNGNIYAININNLIGSIQKKEEN